MKKKLGFFLLAASSMLFIYLTCFLGGTQRLSDISISEEAFEKLKEMRKESGEGLLKELRFDEETLLFDKGDNTFYYSMPEGRQNADNPYIGKKADDASVKLAFGDMEITRDSIREDHTFKLIAYNDNFYSEYNLKCTTLPLMNIDCLDEITRKNVPMNMTLFDNGRKATQKVITSDGNIHIRGASTSKYPKKSYRLSLTQSSVGGNQRTNDVSLLGMRQDDDWILYPAYNDQEKIRNVFSSNLWKYTCAKDNSLGLDNGMEYKYLELFMNGEYWGLYALGYPIDELQLGIDFDRNEHLYKKISWANEKESITNAFEGPIEGYETTGSGTDDWTVLREYYIKLFENRNTVEELYGGIDIDNAIDMYLFINLVQGLDNADGSKIKNMYLSFKYFGGREVLLYTPWDLDATWGNSWYPSPYIIASSSNFIMVHGNLQALIAGGDEKIWDLVLSKYWQLRGGTWSEEKINAMLDKYELDIYGSGAYLRDMARWPEGTYANAADGLSVFRAYVMERLREADKYYMGLKRSFYLQNYNLEGA